MVVDQHAPLSTVTSYSAANTGGTATFSFATQDLPVGAASGVPLNGTSCFLGVSTAASAAQTGSPPPPATASLSSLPGVAQPPPPADLVRRCHTSVLHAWNRVHFLRCWFRCVASAVCFQQAQPEIKETDAAACGPSPASRRHPLQAATGCACEPCHAVLFEQGPPSLPATVELFGMVPQPCGKMP